MTLKQLMQEYNLTIDDLPEIADKMGCSIETARSYLYRKNAKVPQYRLDLLKLNLEKEKS